MIRMLFSSVTIFCIAYQSCFSVANVENNAANANANTRPASECSSCPNSRSMRTRSPQELQRDKLRLEKEKILNKLRLQREPNVQLSLNDLPSPLLQRVKAENEEFQKKQAHSDDSNSSTQNGGSIRYANDEDDEREDPAKTKVLYIFGQRPRMGDTHTFNCPDSNGRIAGCLEFKIGSELFARHISGASLWLYKTMQTEDGNRTLEITEIQRVHSHHASYQESWITDFPITDGADGWIEVDMSEYIARWQRRSTNGEYRHLRIACNGCMNSAHAPVAIDHHSRKPYLDVKLGKKVATRSSDRRGRRSSNECLPHVYNNCCLKQFYVNFTEIGWTSWILQPAGYYANYCTGSCKMSATTSYNNIIRNVGNTKEAKGEVIDQELVPCCAPTRMAPLDLLYALSSGEIMKRTLNNMKVESCGC